MTTSENAGDHIDRALAELEHAERRLADVRRALLEAGGRIITVPHGDMTAEFTPIADGKWKWEISHDGDVISYGQNNSEAEARRQAGQRMESRARSGKV